MAFVIWAPERMPAPVLVTAMPSLLSWQFASVYDIDG